ncbi:MAG: family 10 glycosylhydrolase [Cyclobacteriaceae bacterium]|nr:family 10 glycosylhydrolase [Cyclobacteriaceae bacterium]MCH8516338.1 family 10 glycosylhydrolase [Cyclobacteriaceae bacterium]
MKAMQRIFLLNWVFVFLILIGTSCQDDEQVESDERSILSFAFQELDPIATGIIDDEEATVRISVPEGTDKSELVPTIEISPEATLNPSSGEPQDFSSFVQYQVTSESGRTRTYTVIVREGESNEAKINSLALANKFVNAEVDNTDFIIRATLPFGSDFSQVRLEIELSREGAFSSPASGETVDLTSPLTIEVTAPDSASTQSYELIVEEGEEEIGVRGVWLTNVDSDVLLSQNQIQEAVALCKELNINSIFAVTYNRAMTTYPSEVMENLTGVSINPIYGGRDPLRELIDAAHAEGIKVFAWFEYGFAAFNGAAGPILTEKPEWAAIDRHGDIVVKNGFWWLNALLPEVQDFMTELVLEVVKNYPDIDGIQGDDRLPAMPSEGGYDEYTVNRYMEEHEGQEPPQDRTNPEWLQWRADILNVWGEDLYKQVKVENPNCLVAMSPSPLNFGFVEYLQDWPAWVQGGYCDLVSPQLYRRDNQGVGVYRSLLNEQINRMGSQHLDIFFPGILSFLGGYVPSEEFLAQMIQANRAAGANGEIHFFYNVLLDRRETFKVLYPAPMVFPDFN